MYEIIDPFAKAYRPDPGDASNVRIVSAIVPTGRHVGRANKLVRVKNRSGGGGKATRLEHYSKADRPDERSDRKAGRTALIGAGGVLGGAGTMVGGYHRRSTPMVVGGNIARLAGWGTIGAGGVQAIQNSRGRTRKLERKLEENSKIPSGSRAGRRVVD